MEPKITMKKPVVPFGVLKAINEGRQNKDLTKVGDWTFIVTKGIITFTIKVRGTMQIYNLSFDKFDEKLFKKISDIN